MKRCAASCPESGPGATRRALPNQIAPGAREICAPPSRVPGAAFRPSAPPPGGSLPASKRPAREKRGRTRARRRRARPILRRSAASRAKAPSVVRVTTPAVASWRPKGAAARVGKARVRVKRLKRRRGARLGLGHPAAARRRAAGPPAAGGLVGRVDIEPLSDFSAK